MLDCLSIAARDVRLYHADDGPEEEHGGEAAGDGTEGVAPPRHPLGAAGKQRKAVCKKCIERCSGRMPHTKVVRGGYELAAVPKTHRGLQGEKIDRRGNNRDNPTPKGN